jgi:hypothetical protein
MIVWLRSLFNIQIRDFRRSKPKKKLRIPGYGKELKYWRKDLAYIKKTYARSISRMCRNFAKTMKLWRREEYSLNDTVLNIDMGRFGKFAMSVVVYFNEEKPHIRIKGGGTEEILLKEFSEEKFAEALKKRQKYIVWS